MKPGHVPFCLLLVQHLLACTLTSETFNPREVVGESLAILDAATLEPAPTRQDAGGLGSTSCSSTELPGCELTLVVSGGPCRSDRQCMSQACVSGFCALSSQSCQGEACPSATCNDGVKNQRESGVDCGGPCRACAAPTCADGVLNQGETAVDCGGRCNACPLPAPTCDDGVKNGTEPIVDCGNAECGLCALDSPCAESEQCATGLCQAGSCKIPECADGKKSGTETDVDCGGADRSCRRCANDLGCAGNGDCASGGCAKGLCVACGDVDGVQNGSETGVDCGGACRACTGQACATDAACVSGVCEEGRCCGGRQADCTRCARRLVAVDIDCNTNGPEASNDCDAFLQCLADNSDVCSTRLAPGCSEDPSGVCNHNSFGGDTGPGIRLADAILGTAACAF